MIAASIIIATGATLFTHGIHEIGSAADAARALSPFAGAYAEVLFGIGLFGASLLAAAILPIATSYVISESLGYEKGVGRRREEAPVFVGIITAMIAISALVAVIPGVPVISLLVGVQVVNGLLLPINLFFIWRLSRSAPRDGRVPQRQGPRRRHGDHGPRDLHPLGGPRRHHTGVLGSRVPGARCVSRRSWFQALEARFQAPLGSTSNAAPIAPPRSPSFATWTSGGRSSANRCGCIAAAIRSA